MDDAAFVRVLERRRDLAGDPLCIGLGDRAAPDAIRERLALDQFEDERVDVAGILESVDVRNVGWLRAASTCASWRKRDSRSLSPANTGGKTFNATSRLSFASRAR